MKNLGIIALLIAASSMHASDLFKELPGGLCDDLPFIIFLLQLFPSYA